MSHGFEATRGWVNDNTMFISHRVHEVNTRDLSDTSPDGVIKEIYWTCRILQRPHIIIKYLTSLCWQREKTGMRIWCAILCFIMCDVRISFFVWWGLVFVVQNSFMIYETCHIWFILLFVADQYKITLQGVSEPSLLLAGETTHAREVTFLNLPFWYLTKPLYIILGVLSVQKRVLWYLRRNRLIAHGVAILWMPCWNPRRPLLWALHLTDKITKRVNLFLCKQHQTVWSLTKTWHVVML